MANGGSEFGLQDVLQLLGLVGGAVGSQQGQRGLFFPGGQTIRPEQRQNQMLPILLMARLLQQGRQQPGKTAPTTPMPGVSGGGGQQGIIAMILRLLGAGRGGGQPPLNVSNLGTSGLSGFPEEPIG